MPRPDAISVEEPDETLLGRDGTAAGLDTRYLRRTTHRDNLDIVEESSCNRLQPPDTDHLCKRDQHGLIGLDACLKMRGWSLSEEWGQVLQSNIHFHFRKRLYVIARPDPIPPESKIRCLHNTIPSKVKLHLNPAPAEMLPILSSDVINFFKNFVSIVIRFAIFRQMVKQVIPFLYKRNILPTNNVDSQRNDVPR